jgi:hypothetical protein
VHSASLFKKKNRRFLKGAGKNRFFTKIFDFCSGAHQKPEVIKKQSFLKEPIIKKNYVFFESTALLRLSKTFGFFPTFRLWRIGEPYPSVALLAKRARAQKAKLFDNPLVYQKASYAKSENRRLSSKSEKFKKVQGRSALLRLRRIHIQSPMEIEEGL